MFLGRRPDEPTDCALSEFYGGLLRVLKRPVFREGKWSLCTRTGSPDNPSFQNLVAWNWVKEDERYVGSKITALVLGWVAVVRSDSRGFGVGGPFWPCAFASIVW